MRDDFADGRHFGIGEAEEVEIQEAFVEVEETEDGILAIHGRDHLDADVQEVRGAAAMDFLLHVAGLRLRRGSGDVRAGGELAHEDTVAILVDVSDRVEDAVDTHANTDFGAHVLNMDIGGAELVGLVKKEVEDFFGRDGA